MRFLFILLVACFPVSVWAADASPPSPDADTAAGKDYNAVVLQGLNKVTGHISTLEGAIDATLHFGNLEIVAHRCWKAPPDERPENAALLDISELKPGEQPRRIFLGWMFSSSPGLSGLEHPVYDITVLACETQPIEKPAAKPGKKKP